MCGIIGFSISNNIDHSNKIFQKSFDKLIHRGPDFQKIISKDNKNNKIKIGFCRLSIQDLSDKANKIFSDDENSLLFNGEIYNYKELKNKYFSKLKFESQSDTEFLFHFLKKFGFNKITEVNGIFAIAWINYKNNKITLARDFTGVKTLYYLHENKNFYFCSEAWFLYEVSKNKQSNFDALNFYLRYGFNHIEQCIFKNIYKALPGEIIEYCLENNQLKKNKYFNFSSNKLNKDKNIDIDLENAVNLNLISDAKIGLFLSGGLDSSIIAALAKKNKIHVEAYTNTYNDQKFYVNNLDFDYTKELCKDLNVKLFNSHIGLNDNDKSDFLKSLSFFDEPLSNLNIFNSFKQAKYAKQNGIKVILTGDGADEIFGGYEKYYNTNIFQNFSWLSSLSKKISKYKNYNKNYFPLLFFEKLNQGDLKLLFNLDIYKEIIHSQSHHVKIINKNLNQTINNFDFEYWMTSDHNFKLDRTLMANSIEGRVPYQDKELVEKYYKVDLSKKINFFKTKILLRENNILKSKFKKRKKQGWHLPERWFVKSMIKPIFFDYLEGNKFLNKKYTENLFNEKYYRKLPINKIVTIFMLMHWNNKTKLF